MRSHWTIWALSILTAETTQTHNCQRPKHPFRSHSTEKWFPNRPTKHLEFLPFLIKETKNRVSPDAAGVCVLQFCCVRRYGPQSNSPILWASGQQTLFWIPAAAAHLQTQQPVRNMSRHTHMYLYIYKERERLARHLACFFKCSTVSTSSLPCSDVLSASWRDTCADLRPCRCMSGVWRCGLSQRPPGPGPAVVPPTVGVCWSAWPTGHRQRAH